MCVCSPVHDIVYGSAALMQNQNRWQNFDIKTKSDVVAAAFANIHIRIV